MLHAEANASAAALATSVTADLRRYPVLRWRWKVQRVLERSDMSRKRGDDYAARVYVTFAFGPKTVGLGERIK